MYKIDDLHFTKKIHNFIQNIEAASTLFVSKSVQNVTPTIHKTCQCPKHHLLKYNYCGNHSYYPQTMHIILAKM